MSNQCAEEWFKYRLGNISSSEVQVKKLKKKKKQPPRLASKGHKRSTK